MGVVPLLSSPRRRRRLAWSAGTLGFLAALLAVFALAPNHNGPAKGVRVAPPTPSFGRPAPPPVVQTETPAAARARKRAERIVRPLAVAFVDDLQRRRNLPRAYSLLSPNLRRAASLQDWQQGRYLPLPAGSEGGFPVVAFSGATTVGLVFTSGERLIALRFDKTKGRWLVDYLHAGHTSSRIGASNYAPPGFLPGSHTETIWTWLALAGGFLAIVGVAALFEQRLRERPA